MSAISIREACGVSGAAAAREMAAAAQGRFRLIGTEVVRSYGVEITGQYTDVVQPPCYRAMVERHYGDSVDRREPLLHRMRFVEQMCDRCRL